MNDKVQLTIDENQDGIEILYQEATHHIDSAKQHIQLAIDTEIVRAYWYIGRGIVAAEQKGKERADYGSFIIKTLSKKLLDKYGKGFGISTLKDTRQFYLVYEDRISHALRGQSAQHINSTELQSIVHHDQVQNLHFKLGWIHYRALMRVSRAEAREFYEIEAIKNNWSGRELERQIGSLLFDRLAKSKDKVGLLQLAREGQEIMSPEDVIREPMILEFLNLPESHKLVESKLEEALINNLQHFLLELGKGFAFVARQKRLTFGSQHYYADLVFYHTILKCYCIIDLKTRKLSHGDLGQMQLYVNYFDKEIKMPDDNPTIGLVLCTDKDHKMVEYTLGDKAKQIFASKYQFHLPTIEELEKELKREIKEIQYQLKSKEFEEE